MERRGALTCPSPLRWLVTPDDVTAGDLGFLVVVPDQANLRLVRRHRFVRILQESLPPFFKDLLVMLIVYRTTVSSFSSIWLTLRLFV